MEDNALQQKIARAKEGLVPKVSKDKYEEEYAKFCGWCEKNEITQVNQDICLAWLEELKEKYAPTSLYSKLPVS